MAIASEKKVELNSNKKQIKKHPKRQGLRKTLILISFLLFPIVFYYLSPMLPLQGGALDQTIVGSLLVFAGMFILSLFLGRAFCGWICPAGGLQEIVMNLKKNNRKIKAKTFFIKWIIWIPWFTFVLINPFVLGTGISKVDFFYQTSEKGFVSLSAYTSAGEAAGLDQSYIVYYIVVGLILILALVVGKRSFCHHVCWMAPFMILGRWLSNLLRIPSLGLQANKDSCIQCHRCDNECPMSLPVEKMALSGKIEHRECILCGTCADVCPKGVISYTFKSYKK